MAGEERRRMPAERLQWRDWGPYLAERAWGTVRENYSAAGQPWTYFPHDHARPRTFRWNEDGLGGVGDVRQYLCFAFAFWNERDPILKERIFGLSGPEGNHGEDATEYWSYLDSTPTHSWMIPSSSCSTRASSTAAGTGRSVDYAAVDTEDLCIALRAHNAGPDTVTLHVLPTLWFQNTWAWGIDDAVPRLEEWTPR